MEQLLRNRRLGRRCADWAAIRGVVTDCPATSASYGRGERGIFNTDDRPFRSGSVAVGDCKHSVARDRRDFCSPGFGRSRRNILRGHCDPTNDNTNRLQTGIRRLDVSRGASVRGLCNAGLIRVCGLLARASGHVRRLRRHAAIPFYWRSQFVGRRNLPHLYKDKEPVERISS